MRLLPEPDGAFRERRQRVVTAPAGAVWSCVADLGGDPGWYAVDAAWRVRGVIDRALGGPGNRGRPDRALAVGDPVDGWRVEAVDPGRSLTLVSEHRMPGTARMTHEVADGAVETLDAQHRWDRTPGAGCVLLQRLEFFPRGWAGRAMWWAELPAHTAVMSAMLTSMAREAERRARADGTMGG